MEIDYICGRSTHEYFGISKYSYEIFSRLNCIKFNTISYPHISSNHLIDGAFKRIIYPLIVRGKIRSRNIKHITNQDLAFLLTFFKMNPVVTTCFDLIPWTYYNIRTPTWKMILNGLKKSDYIITISEFSKNEIIKTLDYPEERIFRIYCGVDTNKYFPRHNRNILSRYGVNKNDKIILYVGSEEPRKNLHVLLDSISKLKESFESVKLIKTGNPGFGISREVVEEKIRKYGLEEDVIFTGYISEDELPSLYNSADILAFPSFYEGFGLPPLEAMACGCPVITSNTTSLPEVIGDSGLMIDPHDADKFCEAMELLLIDDNLRKEMIVRGLNRVKSFSWEDSAIQTFRLYKKIRNSRAY